MLSKTAKIPSILRQIRHFAYKLYNLRLHDRRICSRGTIYVMDSAGMKYDIPPVKVYRGDREEFLISTRLAMSVQPPKHATR